MKKINLYAFGDTALSGFFSNCIRNNYYLKILNEVKNLILKEKGVVFINLEMPFSDNDIKYFDYVSDNFRVFSENIKILEYLGINVVNLATNHIKDFGDSGIKRTISLLNKKNIESIGAGLNIEEARKPVIIKSNGFKLGFLGYCKAGEYSAGNFKSGSAPIDLELIQKDVKKLRPNVDFLIISLHWGLELSLYPSPEQVNLAHQLVDIGADVIFGHHPHVVQGIETYKGKIIFYSLGNFIFDDSIERVLYGGKISERKESIIAKVKLYENKKIDYELIPIYLDKDNIIRIADGKMKEKILKNIKMSSKIILSQNLEHYFYSEGVKDIIKREIGAYRVRWKNEKFKFLLWVLRNFKLRYIIILFKFLMLKLEKIK